MSCNDSIFHISDIVHGVYSEVLVGVRILFLVKKVWDHLNPPTLSRIIEERTRLKSNLNSVLLELCNCSYTLNMSLVNFVIFAMSKDLNKSEL